MHAARVKRNGQQITLWDDMRTAGREFMNVAFKQRRQGIVGDCRQLNTDITSYNENYNPAMPIQISLDFTWDVAELDAAAAIPRASTVRKRPFGQSPTALAG